MSHIYNIEKLFNDYFFFKNKIELTNFFYESIFFLVQRHLFYDEILEYSYKVQSFCFLRNKLN